MKKGTTTNISSTIDNLDDKTIREAINLIKVDNDAVARIEHNGCSNFFDSILKQTISARDVSNKGYISDLYGLPVYESENVEKGMVEMRDREGMLIESFKLY